MDAEINGTGPVTTEPDVIDQQAAARARPVLLAVIPPLDRMQRQQFIRAATHRARREEMKLVFCWIEGADQAEATPDDLTRDFDMAQRLGGDQVLVQLDLSRAAALTRVLYKLATGGLSVGILLMAESERKQLASAVAGLESAATETTVIWQRMTLRTGQEDQQGLPLWKRIQRRISMAGPISGQSIAIVILLNSAAWFVVAVMQQVLHYPLPLSNMALIFLLPVIVAATRFGVSYGLVSALAGLVMLNYLYIKATNGFSFENVGHLSTALLFLCVALLASALSDRSRRTIEKAHSRQYRTALLLDLGRKLTRARDKESMLRETAEILSRMLDRTVHVSDVSGPLDAPARLIRSELSEFCKDAEVPQKLVKVWRNALPYDYTDEAGKQMRLHPIEDDGIMLGLIAYEISPDKPIPADASLLVSAVTDKLTLAIARKILEQRNYAMELSEEKERLRSMLLSSVSHDLKTPLASIIGSLSALTSMGDMLDEKDRHELTETALDEAERLSRFVHNILEMARLETGAIDLDTRDVKIGELMDRALVKIRHRIRTHKIDFDQCNSDGLVDADPQLAVQVLQNVFENAAKYAPADSPIRVDTSQADGVTRIAIEDFGPGVAKADRERVFSKYTRLEATDRTTAGTGLGLAIARTLMQAQGGSITFIDPVYGNGARVELVFNNGTGKAHGKDQAQQQPKDE